MTVAVLNREMDRRRQEEEQRAMEVRRIQQLEVERLRRQSLESTEPRLEVPPTVMPESSIDTRASGLTASPRAESRRRILRSWRTVNPGIDDLEDSWR